MNEWLVTPKTILRKSEIVYIEYCRLDFTINVWLLPDPYQQRSQFSLHRTPLVTRVGPTEAGHHYQKIMKQLGDNYLLIEGYIINMDHVNAVIESDGPHLKFILNKTKANLEIRYCEKSHIDRLKKFFQDQPEMWFDDGFRFILKREISQITYEVARSGDYPYRCSIICYLKDSKAICLRTISNYTTLMENDMEEYMEKLLAPYLEKITQNIMTKSAGKKKKK